MSDAFSELQHANLPAEPERPRLPDDLIPLLTASGRTTTLAVYSGRMLVVQLVRYFGCLPCQEYLRELDRRKGELEAMGAMAIAVGSSADYQARQLREFGIAMPLLLDPDGSLRNWLGFIDLTMRQMAAPRDIGSYLAARRSGLRPRVPTRDVAKSPGIAIFDADLRLIWIHEGRRLGDYPPIHALLATVASLRRPG